MRRLLAVGLVIAVLVGAVPALGTTQESAAATSQTITTSQEFDDVTFHVKVYSNASARWTFHYEKTFNNQSERKEFQQFAKRFNNSNTPLYKDFRQNAINLTSSADNQTKRRMTAQNFSKQAYVGGGGLTDDAERGVVEMSFVWDSFAYTDTPRNGNKTLVVGDVFKGGLYLGTNQTLTIEPANGMSFVAAEPKAKRNLTSKPLVKSDSVSWSGEYKFNDQRPMVRFDIPNKTETATTATTTGTTNVSGGDGNEPPGGGESPEGDSPMMLFVVAVVVLVGLAAVFAWRQGGFGPLAPTDGTPGGGSSGGGGGTAARTTGTESTAEPAVSEEELLTDEARVKKLLHENGGRMKQVNIVKRTGWSKSKVSMLLSEMEDDGDISKLRVGRENIISLDGHEPDAAGSPLDN